MRLAFPAIRLPFLAALLALAAISCAQLQDENGQPLFTRRPVATPAAGTSQAASVETLNLSEADFPGGWVVESKVTADGASELAAYSAAHPGSSVQSSVRRFSSEPAAASVIEQLKVVSAGGRMEQLELGDDAVLIRDENAWSAFIRSGSILARLTVKSGGDARAAGDSAAELAQRLSDRIAGKPEVAAAPVRIIAGALPSSADGDVMSISGAPESLDAVEHERVTAAESNGATQPVEAAAPSLATAPGAQPEPTADASHGDDDADVSPETEQIVAAGSPELVIDDLTPNPPLARQGESINWTYILTNSGSADSGPLQLQVFASANPAAQGFHVLGGELPGVAAGDSFRGNFLRKATAGEILTVVIAESEESEEPVASATIVLTVSDFMLPDLAIRSAVPSIYDALPGQTVDWVVTVENKGPGNMSSGASIEMTELVGAEESKTSTGVPQLAKGEVTELSFPVEATADRTISFEIDPSGQIDEVSRDDNTSGVLPTRTALRPDLNIESVVPLPRHPQPGQPVAWRVVIANEGPGDSQNSRLQLFSEVEGTEPKLVSEVVLPGIQAGTSTETVLTRTASAVETLTFSVDLATAEVSGDNNRAVIGPNDLFLPDLEIVSVEANRLDIWQGQGFTWNLTVKNIGASDTIRLTRLAMLDPESGAEIGSTKVPLIKSGEEQIVRVDLLEAIDQVVEFVVDPDGLIDENSEENNTAAGEVVDVLVHDAAVNWLAVTTQPDEDNIVSWRWSITNNGPGRAHNLTVKITVYLIGGSIGRVEQAGFDTVEPGQTIQGGFRREALLGERLVIEVTTEGPIDKNPANDQREVLSTLVLP